MYTFVFYVPQSHLAEVKHAVFAAGAGSIGNYQHCCWQVLGQGQFQPMPGSQPFTGQQDQLSQVAEWRVEMVVDDVLMPAVMAAFRSVHPYEEPAYAVYRLEDF
ncbi:NGG1p interacting factor NIF3 [Denitrificimonas sp. JX-1]|uniref:NGG1p interacting factor NIF3 n=1 Tax=Denitrificimonas halotolerans TaxID=3098930 RepID=A0ABU5GNE4_9GAMM|nr:NGG1p interacting factor NIF3 [Denitrificimonas sp. JX-1]MDY7218215.1 NGG1p interacting factor NIF3 [Denitrificimonas sp. JX-1]